MSLDITKPIELRYSVLDRKGKDWKPGVYQPGELPDYIGNDTYCVNATEESAQPSQSVVGAEPVTADPVQEPELEHEQQIL